MATDEQVEKQSHPLLTPELRLQILALLASEPQPKATMTYDEFLAWANEDTLAEWVDGRVVLASPVGLRHQEIVNFLVGVLSGFARLHGLGRVLNGSFQMKLAHSGREPDVLFVGADHLDRLTPTYLDGPADLVIEVISPESIGRDRGDKFSEYEQAGISEYWLLDPDAQRAEFYQLDASGHYQPVAADADHIYRSRALPGLWLNTDWLWQDPLPAVEEALLTVAGDAYARSLLNRLRRQGFLPAE